ncbi:hypothetical protein C4J81_11610 [Deltaproteobacteria bacterium Smac51]|nr:hypothetical protein C4J81_11610 [Deltaproteobacteria bacterium Smac51]
MKIKALAGLAVIFLAVLLWWNVSGFSSFTIINVGNLHSQILPFETLTAEGGDPERQGGLMYMRTAMKDLKSKYPDSLVVSPGDMVMGLWWRLFGGEPEAKAIAMLGINVGAVGNHEFSLGVDYFKKALAAHPDFPVLASNLEIDESGFTGLLSENTVLTTPTGDRVGFFSLMPPFQLYSSQVKSTLVINSAVADEARAQVKKLQSQGVDAVVLLSHMPLNDDLNLAAAVDGIDLIINGDSPFGEVPVIHWVNGAGGWKTAVVSSTDKGRLLTATSVVMHRGSIVPEKTTMEVVHVDDSLAADQEAAALAEFYEKSISARLDQPIGVFSTPVDARKSSTRSGETPLGDFLTDALRWGTGAQVAVMNAGGIRGDRIFPAGPVSMRNVHEIFPFNNTIWVKQMTGSQIRDMLSLSASALIGENDAYEAESRPGTGAYLHLSGLHVTLAISEINAPAQLSPDGEVLTYGNRLKAVNLGDHNSQIPLNDLEVYTVAMPSFLADGADKYLFLKDLPGADTQLIDADVVIDYIRSFGDQPVNMVVEDRVHIGFGRKQQASGTD